MDKRSVRPIELTLYNPETNEPIKTYVRSYVPWGVLKQALAMREALSGGDLSADTLDELAGLVVAAFGDQFSVEQVTAGTDAGEMITVIQAILSRAAKFTGAAAENPTLPATRA